MEPLLLAGLDPILIFTPASFGFGRGMQLVLLLTGLGPELVCGAGAGLLPVQTAFILVSLLGAVSPLPLRTILAFLKKGKKRLKYKLETSEHKR